MRLRLGWEEGSFEGSFKGSGFWVQGLGFRVLGLGGGRVPLRVPARSYRSNFGHHPMPEEHRIGIEGLIV